MDHSSEERISERIVETSAFPSSKKRSSERILEQITVPSSDDAVLSGLWSNSLTFPVEVFLLVFSRPHQLGLLMRALLVVDSGMGKARFAGEVAPRALSFSRQGRFCW